MVWWGCWGDRLRDGSGWVVGGHVVSRAHSCVCVMSRSLLTQPLTKNSTHADPNLDCGNWRLRGDALGHGMVRGYEGSLESEWSVGECSMPAWGP